MEINSLLIVLVPLFSLSLAGRKENASLSGQDAERELKLLSEKQKCLNRVKKIIKALSIKREEDELTDEDNIKEALKIPSAWVSSDEDIEKDVKPKNKRSRMRGDSSRRKVKEETMRKLKLIIQKEVSARLKKTERKWRAAKKALEAFEEAFGESLHA